MSSTLLRVVLLALLSTIGCSSGNPTGTPPPPPPPPSGPVQTDEVDVLNNFFSPTTATVDAGTTVTWTWQVSVVHNVTFQDGDQSSGDRSSGTHQRTFPVAGTFRYRCTIHSTDFASGMSGSVVVQ